MTDAEVICGFMEPMPTGGLEGWMKSGFLSPEGGWWVLTIDDGGEYLWVADTHLTLDSLHEVEERLTPEQLSLYDMLLRNGRGYPTYVWHADAPQRIKALAAVLREAK